MSRSADLEHALGRSVSRETLERLEAFDAALLKWSSAINLIAKATYADSWSRHILDSAQLYPLARPNFRHWADLGAGGGLPGLVIACLAAEENPGALITLVESDARKAAFLATTARQLGLNVKVLRERIEKAAPLGADILSARALAALPLLLSYAHRHLDPEGTALLPKGRNAAQEVEDARQSWHFVLEITPSRADPDGAILVLRNLRPLDGNR